MAFMDFLNRLAGAWNEGAEQGNMLDWAQRQSLAQEQKRLETLFPIQLRQKQQEMEMSEPFLYRQLMLKSALGQKPKGPMAVAKGASVYDPATDTWRTPPGGQEDEDNPFSAWEKVLPATKKAIIPPTEPAEGVSAVAPQPTIGERIAKVTGKKPSEQLTYGVTAQGKPTFTMRDRPRPAGDANAIAQGYADDLEAMGMDPVLAKQEGFRLATQELEIRRRLLERATQTGRTDPDIVERAANREYVTNQAGALGSSLGKTAGELTPVSPTGAPVAGGKPAITARGEAAVRGEALPASERARFSELYTLVDSSNELRRLTNNFDPKKVAGWFGPLRGYVTAPFAERVTGNISPEEVKARRLMYDMSDMLLRARSGAQINEQEYQRLARLLPTPDLPLGVALARFQDFERQLQTIISNRSALQAAPAGALPTPNRTRNFDSRTGGAK